MSDIFEVYDFENEQHWLKGRTNGIGGSDASAVVGMNPYKSNIDLFEEKIGRVRAKDISDKPCVIYGKKAEEYMALKTMLRQLISKWGIMSIDLQKAIDKDMAVIQEDGSAEYVDNGDLEENVVADQELKEVAPEENDSVAAGTSKQEGTSDIESEFFNN